MSELKLDARPANRQALRKWLVYYLDALADAQYDTDIERKEKRLSVIYYHLYRNGMDLRMVERFAAERMGIAGTLFWETTEQKEWRPWRKLMKKDLESSSRNG